MRSGARSSFRSVTRSTSGLAGGTSCQCEPWCLAITLQTLDHVGAISARARGRAGHRPTVVSWRRVAEERRFRFEHEGGSRLRIHAAKSKAPSAVHSTASADDYLTTSRRSGISAGSCRHRRKNRTTALHGWPASSSTSAPAGRSRGRSARARRAVEMAVKRGRAAGRCPCRTSTELTPLAAGNWPSLALIAV